MIDLVAQLALSNLLVSAALAVAAYVVHHRGRYPVLAHLLWVLVLLKLVTPPLLTLPVATVGGLGGELVVATAATTDLGIIESAAGLVAQHATAALLLAWAIGALIVLFVSSWRIARFDRLIRTTSSEAPVAIQHLAAGLIGPLGLRSAPTIYLSQARLSPLTWWAGRRVRIVLPAELPAQLDAERLRWVIAHELAHVKRRDYLVRWLEWLACVAFWWNPIVWWARRNLREDEEAACDALVVDRLEIRPRSYAGALLAVVEFLSGATSRPPAVATGIDADGALERRLLHIVATGRIRQAPRWLAVGVMSAALVAMPFGIGSATDVVTPSTPATPQLSSGSDSDAPPAPVGETFAMLSAELPNSEPRMVGLGAVAITGRATARTAQLTTRTRRAVKQATLAAQAAGPDGTVAAKRAARKAIAKARVRLGRAVVRDVISRQTARTLVTSLRSLLRADQSSAAAPDLDEAIAAGIVTPRTVSTFFD